MDASITAAGRALQAGDPLVALQHVALREDAPALALRGIALAQLGDLARARALLRRAARAFGPGDALARARCRAAEAEVALATRDLHGTARPLEDALEAFAAHGDRANVLHARLLRIRRLLLVGRVGPAARACAALELDGAPARLAAVAGLLRFEVALRQGRAERARAALASARQAAARSGIGALRAEVEQAGQALGLPAARLAGAGPGDARPLTLAEVEALLASADLVVDGCRRAVRRGERAVSLARRPVLFSLACGLAGAWPGEAARDALVERAFGVRHANASHRVRLRVEIGRLRRALRGLAAIRPTARGFALVPRGAAAARWLTPPVESPGAPGSAVLALLSDGQAWSTSSLALALGTSPRTVQRALAALEGAGQARAVGRGRARRWLAAPVARFATALLLPGPAGPG